MTWVPYLLPMVEIWNKPRWTRKHSSTKCTDCRSSLHSQGEGIGIPPWIPYLRYPTTWVPYPLDTLPHPPEGTWDKRYSLERTWYQWYPTPDGQNDTRLWKHYIPATSLAVGKNTVSSETSVLNNFPWFHRIHITSFKTPMNQCTDTCR